MKKIILTCLISLLCLNLKAQNLEFTKTDTIFTKEQFELNKKEIVLKLTEYDNYPVIMLYDNLDFLLAQKQFDISLKVWNKENKQYKQLKIYTYKEYYETFTMLIPYNSNRITLEKYLEKYKEYPLYINGESNVFLYRKEFLIFLKNNLK